MKVPAVLKNKYLFYALAVLAALNVIGYASVKAYECLALFLLTGYGMHCYCSNKSLAILAALFVANFVFGCGRVKEGFEEAMKAPGDLLKDAANAAAEAGGQLVREGADGDTIKACSVITGALLDTSAQCVAAKKEGKSDGAVCNYTKAIEGKCMKNNAAVDKNTEALCTADGGQWDSSEKQPATCA